MGWSTSSNWVGASDLVRRPSGEVAPPSLMTQRLWSVNTGGKSLRVIKKILLLQVLAGTFDEMKAEVPGECAGKNLSASALFARVSHTPIGDLGANCSYKTVEMNFQMARDTEGKPLGPELWRHCILPMPPSDIACLLATIGFRVPNAKGENIA